MDRRYDYDERERYSRYESTRPRRSRRVMTVAEIREDTFKRICKTILPITLVIGIGIGAGGVMVKDAIDNHGDSHYIAEQTSEFRDNYISPNTHRTQDNTGYWFDYREISKGIRDADDPDDAIFFCYESIGSLQTGRVIACLGFDTFTDYITSKGFQSVDDYEDFMLEEISLKSSVEKDSAELNRMLDEHHFDDSTENSISLGGK